MTLLQSESQNPKRARRKDHIADLATLPVFFNLKDQKVVLAGSGDGAAWKAELLAAAGAQVHIYASAPEEEMTRLLTAAPTGDRCYVRHQRDWQPDDFKGAMLAVGEIEEAEEAERFLAAANSAGAMVNIIDNPAYCQFQFGSIVNRSPVVISISTDGAAPILGQAIRRRIESLIPPMMSEWAHLAQRLRPAVMERFKPGAGRRRFWEAFVDIAFSGAHASPATGIDDLWADLGLDRSRTSGKVTFIDTWHGQGDLLPMRAIRALHSADIIVYGDETSCEILELARREARRLSINDAKSSLGETDKDTTDLLKKLVLSGKHVVRLISSVEHSGMEIEQERASLARQSIETTLIPTIAKPVAESDGRAPSTSGQSDKLPRHQAMQCPERQRYM
ncbi:NAD(P)-dependent oxidoreductase [uncultured Cohaesibacter sp.]|uniref:siroheme synthase n=1 Tax=uncultured Cohaesibacter sp. TaxID=1002546 RepID=UPI0029C97766|nr:NAD(P)-dependent oxidoreductase [uncultured Cohaesibacter sp.]